MFVDACAIISLFAGEDSAPAYEAALTLAEAPFTSPLAAWEAIIVLSRPDQLNFRQADTEAVVTEWLDARLRRASLRSGRNRASSDRLSAGPMAPFSRSSYPGRF